MKAALQVSGNLTVCPTPLRLDSYDGCTGGCAYCFARVAALSSTGAAGKHDSFEQVQDRAHRLGPKIRGEGKSAEAAMRRLGVPLHLGGMADPFQPCERERQVTLGFLREIAEAQAPVVCSTKFALLAEDPWRSAWEAIPQRLLQVSCIAADDVLARAEPSVASWQERLTLIRELSQTTPCVIRVQPFVRGVSERSLNALCEQAAAAGAQAIIVEGLKLPARAWRQLDGALRSAFGTAYKSPANKTGGDRDYSWAEKFAYQLQARRIARSHGLGHYAADNALRWLGDSAQCCATDLIDGAVGHWRANWGHTMQEAMRSGEVRFGWLLNGAGEAQCAGFPRTVNAGNAANIKQWSEAYGEVLAIRGDSFHTNTGNGADFAEKTRAYSDVLATSGDCVNDANNGVKRRRVAAAYGDVLATHGTVLNSGQGSISTQRREVADAYGDLSDIMDTNPSNSQVNTANGVRARQRSDLYGTGKQTLAAWYRYVWNQTRAGRGPQAIVPNLIATHEDENGDAVYRFVLPQAIRDAVHRATGEEVTGGYLSTEEAMAGVPVNAS